MNHKYCSFVVLVDVVSFRFRILNSSLELMALVQLCIHVRWAG